MIDLGDHYSMAGKNADQIIRFQAFHRLTHRSATNTDALAQRLLRPEASGRQL